MHIQPHSSTHLYQDLVSQIREQAPVAKPLEAGWLQDSLVARPATQLTHQFGHSAVGRAVNQALNDPFLFLNHLGIGGFRGNIASANAAFVGQVASTRFAGAVIGAAIGAVTGVGQALLTLPSTGTAIFAGLHGMVAGAAAGSVSVLEHDLKRIEKAQSRPLW